MTPYELSTSLEACNRFGQAAKMDPALMEKRLRAFYAEHNADNQQNMYASCSSLIALAIGLPLVAVAFVFAMLTCVTRH